MGEFVVNERVEFKKVILFPQNNQDDLKHGVYLESLKQEGNEWLAIPHYRENCVGIFSLNDFQSDLDGALIYGANGQIFYRINNPNGFPSYYPIGRGDGFWILTKK